MAYGNRNHRCCACSGLSALATHRMTIKPRFGELDPYNHVNHAVYVSYFEAGRTEALEGIGLGLPYLQQQGWQVVVADLTVKFRRAATAGDTLIVETTVTDIGAVVSTWVQRIVGAVDGQVFCEAQLRAGAVGIDGRPKRMAPELIEQLRALSPDPS
jgi:YbgC/YbaW family acyl-CoA thioester hydrolase